MLSLPIYRIYIDDTVDGVQKISLVHSPAVESNFLSFNEKHQEKSFRFTADEEQHIIFGCSIRADFPIYRIDPDRGEYYVVFDKKTIKDINERFAKDNNFNSVNLDHSEDTDGVYMIGMFIKDVENGLNPKGFEDIEDGSLFTMYKVEKSEVWDKVKDGSYLGLSIEGVFRLAEIPMEEPIAASKQEPEEDEDDELTKIINEILN